MECLKLQNEERIKELQSWEMNEEIQIFREYLRFPTVHPNINYRKYHTTWSSGHYSLFRTLWSHMIRPHDDVVLFLIHYLGLISLAYTLGVSENFLRKNRISGDTCWSSSMTIFSWDISLSDSCLYTKRLIFISFQSHAFIFLNVSVKIWVWKYRSFIL